MNEVEFLPERIQQQRACRSRLMRSGWLVGMCVLAMAALTVVRQDRIASARADMQTLSERAENVERQVAIIDVMERQMADLLIKKRIDDELGSRADCTAALAELCRIMPASMALESLGLETADVRHQADPSGRPRRNRSPRAVVADGRPGKPKIERRLRLIITGVVPSDVEVANFIGQMSASCLFEDVNMGYARTIAFHDRQAREFQASCYLVK